MGATPSELRVESGSSVDTFPSGGLDNVQGRSPNGGGMKFTLPGARRPIVLIPMLVFRSATGRLNVKDMKFFEERFAAAPEGTAVLFFIQIFATLGFAVLYSTLVLYATKHLQLAVKWRRR